MVSRRAIQQTPQTNEEMFDAVVRNAIDFVDSSLDQLERRPKNGIVDFYNAIELFLKTRMMAAHSTFIVSKMESTSFDRCGLR